MKKTILFILLISLIFLTINFPGIVKADYCNPTTGKCSLGDLNLNILGITTSAYNDVVSCGYYSYNPASILSSSSLCGSNTRISTPFGTMSSTPGGNWYCQYGGVCSQNSIVASKLQAINTLNGEYTYPPNQNSYFQLPGAEATIGYSTNYAYPSILQLWAQKEYYDYFKDEIKLASSGRHFCYEIYSNPSCGSVVEPSSNCPSGYIKISESATNVQSGGCDGYCHRTEICAKGTGIINLDYNQTKCQAIFGTDAWNVAAQANQRCCGDDESSDVGHIVAEKICSYNSGTQIYSWQNPPPKGTFDQVGCEINSVLGWTCDANNYNYAIDVHFYADGEAGAGGTMIGATTANKVRESAVGTQCGGNSTHGFEWTIPDSLKDGQQHTIYAYGIDYPSQNNNPKLDGSPKIFTCGGCNTYSDWYSIIRPHTLCSSPFNLCIRDSNGNSLYDQFCLNNNIYDITIN